MTCATVVASTVVPGNTHERTGSPSRVRAQADDHLRVAVAAVLAVPALAQGRQRLPTARLVVLILVIDLDVHARRVPEDEVDVGAEQIRRPEEDLALDGLAMRVEEVQGEVALFERERFGLRQVDARGQPVLVTGELGQRLHQAVGDHREQRQLVRGPPLAPPLRAAEDLADAACFPARAYNVDGPQRAGPFQLDLLTRGGELRRRRDAVVADARDTALQAEQRLALLRVGAAEVVNDVRGGMAFGGILAGLGELVVLGDRAVAVAAAGDAQVHACIVHVSPAIYQAISAVACSYVFRPSKRPGPRFYWRFVPALASHPQTQARWST